MFNVNKPLQLLESVYLGGKGDTPLQIILDINPCVTNGLSNPYHFDESTFIFRGIGSNFFYFISFFDENYMSKQISPRWDAAFCGVTSGLF